MRSVLLYRFQIQCRVGNNTRQATQGLSFVSSQFSTSTRTANHDGDSNTAATTMSASALKRMIQPFILKCHPDMAKQQGLSEAAQNINLKAIQNLNSFVDGSIAMHSTTSMAKYPFDSKQSIVEIDFVLALPGTIRKGIKKKSKQQTEGPSTSRRLVELAVPPPNMPTTNILTHAQQQFVKLLRIAGLSIKPEWQVKETQDHDHQTYDSLSMTDDRWMERAVYSHAVNRHGQQQQQQRRPKTKWEQSRDQFRSRINWNRFDQVYKEAIRDMQADLQTDGMIRNTPRLRQATLARILKNVKVEPSITPLERLVALRRLLGIFDEQFDHLEIEMMGKYWEELRIELHPARSYNISASALRKRRQRDMDTGYCFKIHSDNQITVQVPIDFHETELIEELNRNLWDFYNWVNQDEGIASIFQ